jgi:aspartyl-tRNA(Asn)/glutamyl-tRNA(Gln) amidotransferase subunit A
MEAHRGEIGLALARLGSGEATASDLMREALAAARRSPRTNTYLSLNPRALQESEKADEQRRLGGRRLRPLLGIPVSVKDLFDLAGERTTCGSSFYADLSGPAPRDAAYVRLWRAAGVQVVGKTHLNEFAYGLTGENATWGPCLQPGREGCLTGGSSSGAAASILEGSALAALGTDTGGSIRVPAALCGLVGFRHTPNGRASRGLFPLAPSFDSCGWLQQDLADVALIYEALTRVRILTRKLSGFSIGFLRGRWLEVCEAPILATYDRLEQELRGRGAKITRVEVDDLFPAPELFAALQASEAARIHQRFLKRTDCGYDPVIRARLEWGASLKARELVRCQREWRGFQARLAGVWKRRRLLMAPACPLRQLRLGQDLGKRRPAMLQLTSPFSLAQLPALCFSWRNGKPAAGFGWQVLARPGCDRDLASFAAALVHSGFLARGTARE